MTLVVGAAIVRQGRVLAARRTTGRAGAGGWELPGGKVEPDETPEAALVREIREELACGVAVEAWLAGEQAVDATYTLRAAICRLTDGEPTPGDDHDELRWLGPEELDDVVWLAPDRPFLADLRDVLLDGRP